MFCFKCGCALPDEARFCSQCGTAIPTNTSRPNVTPSAPQASTPPYTPAPIKGGVNIVYPDGHNEIGDIYISSTEIRFVRKSKAVRIAFGFLGSAIENGQEALYFNVSDIVDGRRTRIGLNSNVFQITMRNGDVYRLCLNQPKNISVLEQIVRNR